MPPVAGAIAAYAAVEAAGLAVGSLAAAALGGAVNFVVTTAVNAAFSSTPKTANAAAAAGAALPLSERSQTLTSPQPAQPWQIIYGQVRKGGVIVFRHTTDAGDADTVGTELAGEGHVVPATAPYTVTVAAAADYVSTSLVRTEEWQAAPGDNIYVQTELAATGGAPAAGQYSVSGGTYTFNAAEAGKSVTIQYMRRPAGVSRAHANLWQVIVLAAHECESIDAVYLNDEEVPLDGAGNATGRYAGHVQVTKHLGSSGQYADALLWAAAPDVWGIDHRLLGHCYIVTRFLKDPDLFPTVPNVTVLMKGRKVYDTRSSTTAYSANWALCLADYLNHPVWGLSAAYGTEIDSAILNAAANICDEDVALAAGGTENRFEMHGIVDTSQSPQDVIEKMLTAGAGRLVYVGGKWRIRAGAYITPAVTLDEGDARGAIKVQTRLSRRESFNAVKGVYISPDNNWQPADFPPVVNATYLAEDAGERVWFDMELPFTTSSSAAQRIAKIELERVRQQITVMYPAKLGAYRVEPPEPLMLTNAKFGFSAKDFDVMESRLAMDRDDQGNPVLGVNLALRETAAAVYDWNSGEETDVDLAPDTSLPDPRQIAPPGVPSVLEELYETSDSSGVHSRAVVTWAPAADSQAWRYEHEYKLKSASTWTPSGALINGTRVEIPDLSAGVYQSRVRSVSVVGVRSAWSQAEYEIYGLTAAPGDVLGFAVQSYADQARFVWERSVDLDVRIGGRVIVRWSPVLVGANWNTASLITEDGFTGNSTGGLGPLQTGTYLGKFRDSTGHYSVTAASFVITEALLRELTSLGFVDYHPVFDAVRVNTVVTDSRLQLTAMTLWDDMPGNMDDWGVIDYAGGIEASGSATFVDPLDLGSVQTARLYTTIKSEGFEIGDVWDARTTLMDDWGTIDGDVIEDADVTIMVRITDGDPIGSPPPTWGPWHTLGLVADYTARAFEFRADFSSGDPTHNRRVSELTITAKQPV